MKLRLADKPTDREAIIAGIREFARRRVPDGLVADDDATVTAIANGVIDLDNLDVLTCGDGERIFGGIGLLFMPYPWNPELIMAEEIAFWCGADAPPTTALSLLRFAERHARERRADILMMHALTYRSQSFGAVLQRLGYEPVQSTYMRRLRCPSTP